ncbi:serpin B4 isoform X2 [Alligator mississippiensis]|uniref:serpin B4 isoform X2 n=1 Tax=Alligator mississippiensis TaxID=8496 RepID=UPI002877C7EF|nr:serpin B4 isoform X2 [Alligator mississippiensis]
MASLSKANAEFCFDFFKEVQKSKRKENIFFSPLSISSAMAMVLLGARGNTAKQMEKVLHFDEVSSSSGGSTNHGSSECEETGEVHSQFQALLSAINKPSTNFSLSIANRLYRAKGFHFLEQYLKCTETLYHAELEAVDFRNALEETRKKINTWVEEQTSGKIKELFAEHVLGSDTILVLVNAIYFKGKWTSEFKKEDTKERPFRLNKNQTKNVQMMFQNGYYNLAIIEEPEIQVLELPYGEKEEGELSMFIFLPKDIKDNSTGLEQLDSALIYKNFVEWTTMMEMHKRNVDVYLPRFKMQESCDLGETLQAMGMCDLFDSLTADLSGMTGNHDLAVSKAIHKSYVDVNEEGTEAAAATGVVAGVTSVGMSYEFKADHPFLFLIKHNVNNSILFFGQCTSP